MKKSKYSIPEYWITKILEDTDLWHGLFENKPLNRESIIISPAIVNSFTNQLEKGWVVYPNVYSVLGFISFMYLPTVWKSLIEREHGYVYSFQLDVALEEDKTTYPEKVQQINRLQRFYVELQKLWEMDAPQCMQALKDWTNTFNENWEDEKGIIHSVTVFNSPNEVVEYLIEIYEEDLDIEMLEEDLGMSKEELLKLTSDEIYDNEFLKRKFTEILANKLIAVL